MRGWLTHLELILKSKTGLGSGVLAWGLVATGSGAATLGFAIFAAFIALAQRYGALMAALALAGVFLLLTIVASFCCLSSQRRTVASAKRALAARSHAPWLDPKLIGAGLKIGRAIGWRKLAPLAAVGILAAGLAKEWFDRTRPASEASDPRR
jgi:hypothetical protein